MQTMFHLHFAVKAIVIVILEKSSPLLNRDVSFSHIDQYLTIFMVCTWELINDVLSQGSQLKLFAKGTVSEIEYVYASCSTYA